MIRVSLRLDFDQGRLGPGKIALLEQIAETGSISAAARALAMSYKRAWDLVEAVNRVFPEPLVST
ncbi:MAG: LysR family transcriptional regulator, partial [Rhizobiaceae bacterium]